MDPFSSVNVRWFVVLFLVSLSHQKPFLRSAESFHKPLTKTNFLTKKVGHFNNRVYKISSLFGHRTHSENVESLRLMPSYEFNEEPTSTRTAKSSRSENTHGESISKVSPSLIRFRRSLGFHRSRCCYIDVMCSRGCRRPWGRRRGIRSAVGGLLKNTNVLTRKLEFSTTRQANDHTVEQPTDLESMDKMPTKQGEPVLALNEHSKGNSRTVCKCDDGIDNTMKSVIRSRSGRSTLRPGARNSAPPSASAESKTVERLLPPIRDTEFRILDGLPQILDSLEYLMKKGYSM